MSDDNGTNSRHMGSLLDSVQRIYKEANMGWLDELQQHVDGCGRCSQPISITIEEVNRLISEARKMERVRKSVKRRMERDEYDQIIDDIHEIIEDK